MPRRGIASTLNITTTKPLEGPSLRDFIKADNAQRKESNPEAEEILLPSSSAGTFYDYQYHLQNLFVVQSLDPTTIGQGRSVFIETYGCQMNASDSEIVLSVMQRAGFQQATELETV